MDKVRNFKTFDNVEVLDLSDFNLSTDIDAPTNIKKVAFIEATVNKSNNYIQADTLGVSLPTVIKYKKHEKYRELVTCYQTQLFSRLITPAINRLAQLIYSSSDFVALNACTAILDRCGFKPEEVHKVKVLPTFITGANDLED